MPRHADAARNAGTTTDLARAAALRTTTIAMTCRPELKTAAPTISGVRRAPRSVARRSFGGQWVVGGLCVVAAIFVAGCAPAFRAPRRTDLFRATPTRYEESGLNVKPQRGIPLPDVPPAVDPVWRDPLGDPVPPQEGALEVPLTLEDALRISLGNSGVVRILDGGGASAAAVTSYDPEIAAARARAALAAFDPSLSSSLYAGWINLPPEAIFGPGLAEPTRRDEVNFAAALTKPWMSGTETRIGYNPPLGYLFIPDSGSSGFNPLYTSNLEFTVRQALLKGAGVRANKAPLRIAQIRTDQTALDLQQAVMASVRSVTEAYWDLYSARAAAAAIAEVTPLLERVVYIEEERVAAQRSVRADVAKVQSQLRAVRQQLVQARSAVVQRELRLRNVLGIQPFDGNVLIPTSSPQQAPVAIDYASSTTTALQMRPDLINRRLAVRTREHELIIARNLGLPQLDATGTYRLNGNGEHLDDSFDQMIGANYHDWQASLTLSVPLRRRAAAAGIRAATLQLARERALLEQAVHSTAHQVNAVAQEAEYAFQLFAEADARLRANTEWLEGAKIRYENPPPDGDDWLLAATNDYLTALRSQADAATDAQAYLARYNSLLARLNEATGTILTNYDIQLAGQPIGR